MRPKLRQTHTFVTMDVSANTYGEILQKLLDAGYEHLIDFDGMIALHGLALPRPEGFQIVSAENLQFTSKDSAEPTDT